MSELLDIAIKAHGGLDRWSKVNAIRTAASLTGAIWFVKGRGDVLKNVEILAETKRERLIMDFLAKTNAPSSSRIASMSRLLRGS